jgi:hypothetical protein
LIDKQKIVAPDLLIVEFEFSLKLKMYKLDLPIDLKEKAAIERRRRAEQERQGRIFNAKHRQTGVCIHFVFSHDTILTFIFRSTRKHSINKWKIEIGWTTSNKNEQRHLVCHPFSGDSSVFDS